MAGGAAPYRKGAAHEREVARLLEGAGFFVMRSPKSASPIDLLAVRAGTVYFIQCKLGGYMRPHEREAVCSLSVTHGGVALAAYGRRPVRFVDLTTREEFDVATSEETDQGMPAGNDPADACQDGGASVPA